jgi:hypothetical protein
MRYYNNNAAAGRELKKKGQKGEKRSLAGKIDIEF